ncbi:hypothetical protein BLNAU_18906 [Blattamonas nauphoetae]|uniref:Serine-threonine/tyrosine-protein kinase catalytic domain-containing protein n=1 Tax=Blattamonas nauphoetae TaxID=2049346 RepID=A0ABQ9X3A3_9EUKA|nr:hypothetical protein BLNAU_18906 [Blattamonas nauphoetae]
MNLPVLILIHRFFAEATLPEERILPLSLQMTITPSAEAARISQNEQAFFPPIKLNHGTYHSNAYLLDSVSLSLHGSDTTIYHTSSLANTESVNDPDSENHEYRNGNTTPFIFVFSNSTISMFHISLNCGWCGTSVGRIWSSRLTIENCPIISNPEASPFVMTNGFDDFGSSIFFVDCSHKSIEKSSLLPLVCLAPSHITHASHTGNEQKVTSTFVSCSGLSLCDTHLAFGSGPLVGFSSPSTEQDAELSNKLETVLIGSRLVNMTSGEGSGAMNGWSGRQQILGSSVTRSTNHLYGTTCIDMNLGGSLLCSNTSFSHCHSSLTPEFIQNKTYTLQHKTGKVSLTFKELVTEPITITRCTFLSMTSKYGAAIYHYRSSCHLSVSESSFSKCQMAGDGGAIYFCQDEESPNPYSISSSLFVDCAAGGNGGAVCVWAASTSSITDSVFSGHSVDGKGGALDVNRADSFILSNCVFENCVAKKYQSKGGGMWLSYVKSLTMNSVLFRECSAQKGNDFYYEGLVDALQNLEQNVTNCDSTSEMSNLCFYNYPKEVLDSTLIPAVPDTSAATLVEIGSTPKADQTSSTIQMRVSNNLDGKMLVVVDNTNNHEPPNTKSSPPHVNSPPAIARLLTFDFSSSIESATQTVSFGEWEELQYESEYCVMSTSIANTRLSIPPSIALTTPNPARIVQVVCSLGSGTDHCWIQLKGRTLPIGRYTVTLKTPDLSFSVEFDGSTVENTTNMISSSHSEALFGTGSKLTFSRIYEVESVTMEGHSAPLILDPPHLVFSTPTEQSRVTSVNPASFKDDTTKDTILIPLFTDYQPNGVYVLTLLSPTNGSVSLPVSFINGFTDPIEAIVYSKDSSKIQLTYGLIYTVKELTSETTNCLIDKTLSIEVPVEPMRIEEGRVTLNGAKDEATVRLKGRALTDGRYTLTLKSVDSELISEASLSGDGELLFKVPISNSSSSILTFGTTYTISSLRLASDDVIVNSDVELAVPNPPIVKTAIVHPNSINTTMTLGLTGTDLELDGFYTVTLSPLFSFEMLFNRSTTASSSELLLGRVDSLQHNTVYTIQSIIGVDDDSDVIQTTGSVSFTTPKCRVPLLLHVNQNEGADDVFCGEIDDPCATIDFAWSIVSALKSKRATLAIVKSSEQTHPILMSSGMSVLLSNGGNLEPTLTIPLSASMGDKTGMVVVDDAGFEVIDVLIKIESTDPSFVFLAASESTIILKEGSFIGESFSSLSLNSDSEDVCSWDSGVLRLDNCTTTLNRMTLSSLSKGAIHMKSGNLNVDGVIFRDNSPNLVSFLSARRNIRCVEGGNVTIGSLSGGDGSKDHPSAWISAMDCTLSGEDARPDSPLFVPTLSSKSTSSWIKKEKQFSLSIVGTTMIPCGLSLEVFEMKKDKSEGESARVELSLNNTDSFNETHVNLSIPLTSLSSLDKSLEWRGRLVFGSNQTTSESFVVQKNSADRLAQASLDNMKWWLPLVIVVLCCALVAVFVVVVVLRRRQMRKDLEAKIESGNEMEEEKMKVEQVNHEGGNAVITSADVLKDGSLNQEGGDESKTVHTKLTNTPLSECVSVLDCSMLETKEMLKMETLFDRLHRNKKGLLDKRPKQIELARGLQKLGKMNSRADVLLRLSSHWILVDVDGKLNIQMNRGSLPSLDEQSQVNHTTTNESVLPEDSRLVNVNNENADGMDRAAKLTREKEDQEFQRWQAPEQGGNNSIQSCDVEKVAVFRLGLVLWEIETGQVPFRETDGVNASRQLKAGVKPNMELVQNKEMQELLLKCLELKATDRIDLDNLISSLGTIPDDPAPTQQLFGA